ncbi:MAG TPA: LysR family transcriptional regulator [Actinopolymorphaceae bacterium]
MHQVLNFHRLWIFLQVVDCGSFSAAAQKLYMSQPSVSNQVRRLEAALGATLVDRSGARMRPTAEGEVLAEHARRLFLLADEAVAAVRQVQGLTVGRLAVGGTTTVGTYLLPGLLARFQGRYPQIPADLYVSNTEQVTRRLLDGDIGVAVFARRPAASQLYCEEILTDRLALVTAPGHRLAGRSVRPGDLAAERFLLRERGSATRQVQTETLRAWRLEDVDSAEMWGPETLKRSVEAGLGIALVSEHAIDRELRDGRLATVTVEPPPGERRVVVGYRRDRVLSPAEQAYLSLLRETDSWPATPTR